LENNTNPNNTNIRVYTVDSQYNITFLNNINKNTDLLKQPLDIIYIFITPLLAGIGILVGNLLLDYFKRPQLEIYKETIPEKIFINIFDKDDVIYKTDPPTLNPINRKYDYLPEGLRDLSIIYIVQRITIKNNSTKSAAEDCKGILKINNLEEKICWSIPSEKYKMTINAGSVEYLDLCAFVDPEELNRINLILKISAREDEYITWMRSDKSGDKLDIDATNSLKKHIWNNYIDKIPTVIAPTENGWQPTPYMNRIISPNNEQKIIRASIIITSKNTSPIEKNIRIDPINRKITL